MNYDNNLEVAMSVRLQMLHGWISRNLTMEQVQSFASGYFPRYAENPGNDYGTFLMGLIVRAEASGHLMTLTDLCFEGHLRDRELHKIVNNLFTAPTWSQWWNEKLRDLLLDKYFSPDELVQAAYQIAKINLLVEMPTSGDRWKIVLGQLMTNYVIPHCKQNEFASLVSWIGTVPE